MRILSSSLAIALATLLIAPAVNADSGSAAGRVWLEQLARKLEAQGFELNAMRVDDRGYTLEVRYKDTATAGGAEAPAQGSRLARSAR